MRKTANPVWHVLVCLGLASSLFAQNAPTGKYNGPGGCASSSCHGSIQPKQITRVAQNEYSIWAGQDKHARAYQVLASAVSLRIAKILHIGQPDQSQKCLACHALAVAPDQRAESFELIDGVSCECLSWTGFGVAGTAHDERLAARKSVAAGMYDTRDLIKRSERCLNLPSRNGGEIRRSRNDCGRTPGPDFRTQLVQLRHAAPLEGAFRQRVARRPGMGRGRGGPIAKGVGTAGQASSSSNWPEYAELDCFACHHSLTKPEDSWRQEMGYAGRQPGVPAWNESRYVVFRHVAKRMNSEAAGQLDAAILKLTRLLGERNGNAREIASSATDAAALASQFAQRLNAKTYDQDFTLAVMRSITQDGDSISARGQRAAEQAAMSLDSLFVAYKQNAKIGNEAELRDAINGLFQQVDNPSAYHAPRFAAQMQKVSLALSRAGRAEKVNQ